MTLTLEEFRVRYAENRGKKICVHCRGRQAMPDRVLCPRCRRVNLLRARRRYKAKLRPGAKLTNCHICGEFGHNKAGCDVR